MGEPTMTDKQRHEIETAILLALLRIYKSEGQEVLDHLLGNSSETLALSTDARAAVAAFATDRAQKVQDGVNQRIEMALSELPEDASESDRADALAAAHSEIDQHNHDTLIPFFVRWASYAALVNVYQDTPANDGTDRSAAEAMLWNWQQNSGYLDDCTAAMDASPASLEELFAITEGPPPAHPNCACDLSPA